MADYAALKAEIQNDPLALGYAGKTDAQIAALMNGASRPLPATRTLVPTHEVYEAIVKADWDALTAANQATIKDILTLDMVDASGVRTRAAFSAAFAAGTASRTNLLALTTVTVARSRAQEIFGAAVTDQDIFYARTH